MRPAPNPAPGPLPADTRLLIAARGVRALGQGVLVVDFALYLHALGWNGVQIGAVLSGGLLLGAVLTLLLGPLSDRVGRKGFLLSYEAVQLAAALGALLSSRPEVLIPAAVLGGFGRGGNGGAGPFAPVEQSWLAVPLHPLQRGNAYTLNSATGFFGMAAGAGLALLPGVWAGRLPGALAYRPLFAVVALSAVLSLLLLTRVQDVSGPGQPPEAAGPGVDSRAENHLLLRLAGVNALNGLGIGLVGPLISYWFLLRFGEGPLAIAPVMALAFAIAGASALTSRGIITRRGLMPVVVWMRLGGLLALVLIPLMPVFGAAAALYVLRFALNLGTAGARQAINISLVRAHRRGLAASLSSVSLQIPRALGPAAAGALFGAGALAVPFFAATAFQGAYLYLYQRTFRAYEPGRADRLQAHDPAED